MSAKNGKGSFEEYLESYCELRGVTKEEALQHKIILEIKQYYDSEK